MEQRSEAGQKPFVALTTTIDPQGGDYRRPRIGLYANYIAALERAGLVPLLVTPGHTREAIRAIVGQCSGLVLSGGEDIDPSRYGHDPIPELGQVNPPRDGAEWKALEAALPLDIPVLGICRGHQMLNVFFGGTLCQDIDVEMEEAVSHLQTTPWGSHHHEASVDPESRLGKAIGRERIQINSYHHQALRRVADGLKITARADDGLVEAVESESHRWVVGVQWHPERHEARADGRDPNLRLFNAFAEAVREDAGAVAVS